MHGQDASMENNTPEREGKSPAGNDFGCIEETLFVSVDENATQGMNFEDGLADDEDFDDLLMTDNGIDIYAAVEAECIIDDSENEDDEDLKLDNSLILSNFERQSIFWNPPEPDDAKDPDFNVAVNDDDDDEAEEEEEDDEEEYDEEDEEEDEWSDDIQPEVNQQVLIRLGKLCSHKFQHPSNVEKKMAFTYQCFFKLRS